MTISIRQPAPPKLRQHTDPPGLWAIVVTGSLMLNGMVVLGLQHYLHLPQAKPSPSDPQLIPIEFLQTVPQPTAETTSATPLKSGTTIHQPTISPATSTSSNPASNPPVAIHSSTSTISNSIGLNTSSKTKSTPKTSTNTIKPSQPVGAQSQTNPSPSTDQATSPPISPSGPSPADTTPPDSETIAKSGISLPDFTTPPDPKNNPGTASTAPQTTVAFNQAVTPAKFLMQLKLLPPVSDRETGDRPTSDIPSLQKIFSFDETECTVTPEVQRYFEQPLEFSITLNRKGTVIEAIPIPTPISETPSPNDQQSYRDLATCFLKTWTLPLAALPSSASQSALNQLNVQITLQKQ